MKTAKLSRVLLFLFVVLAVGFVASKPWRVRWQLVGAVRQDDVAMAEAALQAGADPNSLMANSSGDMEPVLAVATQRGGPCAEVLVRSGAAVNGTNVEGRPLVAMAVAQRNIQLVELMLAKGADPNALEIQRDGMSMTLPFYPNLLIMAVRNNDVSMVQMLLAKGAKVNFRCGDNGSVRETPLLVAARESPDLVALLLKAGADPMMKNREGQTALDIARRVGHKQAVAELSKWFKLHKTNDKIAGDRSSKT